MRNILSAIAMLSLIFTASVQAVEVVKKEVKVVKIKKIVVDKKYFDIKCKDGFVHHVANRRGACAYHKGILKG